MAVDESDIEDTEPEVSAATESVDTPIRELVADSVEPGALHYYVRCGCGCGFTWPAQVSSCECPQCKTIWHGCACGRSFQPGAGDASESSRGDRLLRCARCRASATGEGPTVS